MPRNARMDDTDLEALFLYLKACGREELSTMNLWAGMDAPTAAV